MAEEKKEEAAAEPAGPKLILGMPIPMLALVVINVLVMLGGTGYVTFSAIMKVDAIDKILKNVGLSHKPPDIAPNKLLVQQSLF